MKKLFGKNIEPSCFYCENAKKDSTKEAFCEKKMKYIKEDEAIKCKKYRYNPYERIPNSRVKILEYTKEDFAL